MVIKDLLHTISLAKGENFLNVSGQCISIHLLPCKLISSVLDLMCLLDLLIDRRTNKKEKNSVFCVPASNFLHLTSTEFLTSISFLVSELYLQPKKNSCNVFNNG